MNKIQKVEKFVIIVYFQNKCFYKLAVNLVLPVEVNFEDRKLS